MFHKKENDFYHTFLRKKIMIRLTTGTLDLLSLPLMVMAFRKAA